MPSKVYKSEATSIVPDAIKKDHAYTKVMSANDNFPGFKSSLVR